MHISRTFKDSRAPPLPAAGGCCERRSLPWRRHISSNFNYILFISMIFLPLFGPVLAREDIFKNTPANEREYIRNALKSQRMLSSPIPIDRALSSSLDATQVLFDGGLFSTTANFSALATYSYNLGLNRLTLDLFWDQSIKTWTVCPQIYPTQMNASSTSPDDTVVYDYICPKPYVGLDRLLGGIVKYLDDMRSATADVVVLILNLRDLGNTPGNSSSSLPITNTPSTTLSSLISKIFGSHLYTPADLTQERQNLNNTWLVVDSESDWWWLAKDYFEFLPYYSTKTVKTTNEMNIPIGTLQTTNGFPPLQYLARNNKRILVGFGEIDIGPHAVSGYNVTKDYDTIFPASELVGKPQFTVGSITNGLSDCAVPNPNFVVVQTGSEGSEGLIDSPNNNAQQITWKYAYISDGGSSSLSGPLLKRAISCGYHPAFTKKIDFSLLNQTVWTWEYMEPRDPPALRCATLMRNTRRWYGF